MKHIYRLIALFAIAAGAVSCVQDSTSLLDKEESNDIYESMVFTDPYNAIWFLNSVYGNINKGYFVFGSDWSSSGGFLGNAVDEGMWKANWDNAYKMSVGDWTSSSVRTIENPWKKYYKAIRAASRVIEHADEIPDSVEPFVDETVRTRMKAEARFLRALFQYELLKYYGATPIVDKVLTPDDDDYLHSARPTYAEVADYICSEAAEAAEVLPNVDEYDDTEWGRATKGACQALISRVRLYEASPLFNDPQGTGDTPWSVTYSADRWKDAAKAAADFIKNYSDKYSLHQSTDPTKYGNYEDLFLRRYSPEIILASQQKQCACPLERCCLPGQFYSYAFGIWNNFPTLNAASEYEIIKLDPSGHVASSSLLGIDKVLEIYEDGVKDEETGFDPQDPYVNRDPRFYQSIWYNQEPWPARGNKASEIQKFDLAVGGKHYRADFYRSGFCNRKFLDPWANFTAYGKGASLNVTHNFILFRYAEILLNYAEAVNEAYGPTADPYGIGMTPYDAVNMIRRRATYPNYDIIDLKWPTGMPKSAVGDALPDLPEGLSQDEFRERIVHERWVEFYQEEMRYFDLNRWKKRGPIKVYEQVITKNGSKYVYSVTNAMGTLSKAWDDKYYLWPIPEDEIQKSPGIIVQNPGWDATEE